MRTRNTRGGFTLTEVMMAVGILGIGMAMVASVFPVAINQSRRGDELTHAALFARSLAATLRANRMKPLDYGNNYIRNATGSLSTRFPHKLNTYNPNIFVKNRRYAYTGSAWGTGNYTANICMTRFPDRNGHGDGRYLVALAIHKSRGSEVRLDLWKDLPNPQNPVSPAGPGEYVLYQAEGRGEAYAVDYIDTNDTPAPMLADDTIHVMTAEGSQGYKASPVSTNNWVSLTGVVGVYHMIIGN